MAQIKQTKSKLVKEGRRLFSVERGLQLGVSVLTLLMLSGTLYLMIKGNGEGSEKPGSSQYIFLAVLSVFLVVNLVQQRLLARVRKKWSQLIEHSSHDGLTGAFNRESFDEIMEAEISRANRYKFDLSLCIVDLDSFKAYNDTYGHPSGDKLLREFSSRIQSAIRTADCLGRYGGDEFCILLPHTSLDQAERFLSRILPETQKWLATSFSAGVTAFREGENMISFLSRADQALYQAKREGKNQIRCIIREDDRQTVASF